MNILSVAFPWAAVRPNTAGGAEQVLLSLDRGLTLAGHCSFVIAAAESEVSGTLVPVSVWRGIVTQSVRERAYCEYRAAIANVFARTPIDVTHFHGLDFLHYLPESAAPALVTLHLPPTWYSSEVFRLQRPETWLNCVSASQHNGCPDTGLLLPPISNGVDLQPEGPDRKHFFVMALGRICPEKGYHIALDAARSARVPLLLGGMVYPYETHRRYFQDEIVPRLDWRRRFIGPLGPTNKRRLLSQARCLLIPSLAPETSSLVAMESLACGTPVIAFRAGALPEIVENGRTGFLVDDMSEMADAIHASRQLDPAACRQSARDRFSSARMISEYLEVYRRLATHGDPQPRRMSG